MNNNLYREKALIIGAGGFVGKYLAEHLRNDLGYDTILTKLGHESIPLDGFMITDLDIMNPDQISELLRTEKPDVIFHLAAQSSVAVSWKSPQLTAAVNITGSLNLLEAARGIENYSPKILLIGSGEEYGKLPEGTEAISEDTPCRPQNPYAVTKTAQNMFGTLYAKSFGMHIVLVRAFNHIGAGQLPNFAAADFCRQTAEIMAGKRENIIRTGNLSARRDFTDVKDVVRAYGLLAKYGKDGETYNVGSGKSIAIEDLLRMITDLSGMEIKHETASSKLRPSDTPEIKADIRRLKRDTGWEPQIPIMQTLKEMIAYEVKKLEKGE